MTTVKQAGKKGGQNKWAKIRATKTPEEIHDMMSAVSRMAKNKGRKQKK